MRVYQRPPLGPGDYEVSDRGYESPCWVRVGHRTTRGYTSVTIAGRRMFAHRAMYEQEVGAIPEGLQLDHLCRQRDCINPSHLEPVTDAENKRRGAGTRLSHEDVEAIRSDSRSHRLIAVDHGISASHVTRIRSGERWA